MYILPLNVCFQKTQFNACKYVYKNMLNCLPATRRSRLFFNLQGSKLLMARSPVIESVNSKVYNFLSIDQISIVRLIIIIPF